MSNVNVKYGELTNHFMSNPQHELNSEKSELIFICAGCREVGTGSRFHCSICEFDLHIDCTTAASPFGATLRHPFYPKCLFDFYPSPPGGCPRRCNACRQHVNGFVYHCPKDEYDLHPCCAALQQVIEAEDGHRLHLHRRTSARCDWCEQKDQKSWCYRSECKKYNIHVACVKEMLLDNLQERSSSGGGGSSGNQIVILSGNRRMPIVKTAGNGHHKSWKGKVKRCSKMVAIVVRFVIAALLGDPTVVIAGIVHSLLS